MNIKIIYYEVSVNIEHKIKIQNIKRGCELFICKLLFECR